MVDIGQTRIEPEPGEQAVNAITTTGNGAVDAFFGKQQGAFDAAIQHGLQQGFAQRLVIRQGDEFVQRRHDDLVGHGGHSFSSHPRKGRTGGINKNKNAPA
ncbi:hypothetical protein D9M68_820020 [compost metagenome]